MGNNIIIKTANDVNEKTSYQLQLLGNKIETALQITPTLRQVKTPGEKAIGLTEAIDIANLSLTAISTIIAIIQFWKSENSIYSLKYRIGEIEVEASNLTEEEFEKKIIELAKKYPSESLQVDINN